MFLKIKVDQVRVLYFRRESKYSLIGNFGTNRKLGRLLCFLAVFDPKNCSEFLRFIFLIEM